MEHYVISGENATILVDLIDSAGNFLVPDDSLYSYKITDNKGEVLQEEQEVSIESASEDSLKDQILIEANELTNTKGEEEIFSSRYVYVTFTSNGKPYRIRKNYKVINDLYFTATQAEVREVFGVSESELPDDSIDLVKNYIILSTKMGNSFTDAITASDLSNIRANRLLVLTTALSLFNSIRLRLVESESSGTNSYLRSLKYANLDELEQAIKDEIADIEEDITGIADISMENYTPYHLGTRSPDAITGEEVS